MLANYETEQAELKPKIVELQLAVEETEVQNSGIEKFMNLVRRHIEIPELTTELVHEFIERVEVSQGEWLGGRKIPGKKRQKITIYYKYVGSVELPKSDK